MAKTNPPNQWDSFKHDTDRIKDRKIMLDATKECIPLEGHIEDEGGETGTIRLFPRASLKKYNAFIRINKKDVVGTPMPVESGGDRQKSEIRHRLYVKRSATLTSSIDFFLKDKVLKRGRGVVFERRTTIAEKDILGPIVSMNPPTEVYAHLYSGSHCEIQLRKFFGIRTAFGPVILDVETIPYYIRHEDDLRLRVEDPVIELHIILLNGPSESDIHLSVIDNRGIISLASGELFMSDASNRIDAGLAYPIESLEKKDTKEKKDSEIIPGQIVES